MGLVLHELATNATKHGALSLPEGQVRLSWETRDLEGGVRVLELTWVERGSPPVNKSRKAGVGSRLMDHAIANARVTRDFRPEGLVCSMTVPLTAVRDRTTAG
jgi:two-component sensor histidine kinase